MDEFVKYYFARFSILSPEGALWGVDTVEIEIDLGLEPEEELKELTEKVFEAEEDYSTRQRIYFLDYVEDEDGNEIEIERPY